MEIDDAKFEQVKAEARQLYDQIKSARCPYFGEDVVLNSEGFEHLMFKSWNKTRTRVEQYTRLRLLPVVKEILEKSHTLQEYDERPLLVRQKINSRWEKRMRTARYYVFIAIIKKTIRVKIVVKEIEGGSKFFYSLYPAWRVETTVDGGKKKKFYSGNPETD